LPAFLLVPTTAIDGAPIARARASNASDTTSARVS
jgi:hypothetical protein